MNRTLGKLGQEIAAVWKQLGLNQKISIVGAAFVVVAGLLAIGLWSSQVDYGLLYGDLSDSDAAKVVGVLDKSGVAYRTANGGRSILVPRDQVHRMRMELAKKGLPKGEGVGFEIFDRPNFGISDFIQRANYIRAIQGELSRTIAHMDEVEAARVMIVIPENRLLVDSSVKPTASVFVQVNRRSKLAPSAVDAIRFLVAHSVEGLKASDVSVVDNLMHVLTDNTQEDSLAGLSNTQLTTTKRVEEYLARKAEGMLERVLGPGQAVVRVAAEVNWDQLTTTEDVFDPESKVTRSETVTDNTVDSFISTDTGVGGGLNAKATTQTNRVAGTPANNSRTKKKTTDTQYEINKTTRNLVQAAGGLKRLSAAVFVARRREEKDGERKLVPRSPEELSKLRDIVKSALGIQTSITNRRDEITLEEIEFNVQPFSEMKQELDSQEIHRFVWEIVRNGTYTLLALGTLFLFWRSLKKTQAQTIPIGMPIGDFSAYSEGPAPYFGTRISTQGNGRGLPRKEGATAPKAQRQEGSAVTVEVLNQLIRENPDNMTQAVRSWLTRGDTDR